MATGTNPALFRVALLALAVAFAFALWQSRRIKELERQLNSAGADAVALEAHLAAANEARAELAARLENDRPRPAMFSADTAVSAGNAEPRPRGPARRLRGVDTLMSDSVYQKAMLTQMRGSLDGRYAGLFRRLNLPLEQLNRLKDLLVERQASTMDAFVAGRTSGGVLPGGEAMRSLVQETQAEIDAGIHALLGDDQFQQYEDFNANSAQYALADQLERRLSYTPTPLTTEQADELVRIFREYQPATGPESQAGFNFVTAGPAGLVGSAGVFIGNAGARVLSDETMDQAGTILTPEQLTALKEIQAEQRAQQEMFEAMRDSMGVFLRDSPPVDYTVEALPPGG